MWENVIDSDQTVVERAKHLITSWRNAQQIRQSVNITQPSPQQTVWTKPRHGRYKCNVDASFLLDRNKVGLGMCLRDDHGRFVAARTKWIEHIVNVKIGEAIGLLHALMWVEEMQLYDTDFEMELQKDNR
ncbi:cytochrome p450 [Trifolium pratense]|uniref:Cytochrome p450 n=1 Tax=Trifolium pratense TaxID=57577 RepID=A0A2K3JQY4_TRIPR|nr:cytochrome p450 [Trifolium pratense]